MADLHPTHLHPALAISNRPPNRPAGEFLSLDLWRGLACLWVVLRHVASESFAANRAVAAVPGFGFMALGYLGVPIFFVISGYCIANAGFNVLARGLGFRSFAAARIRRIMPPYLASISLILLSKLTLTLLLHCGLLGPRQNPLASLYTGGFTYFFSNITLTQLLFHQAFTSRVAWTLCYEMAFYLIVALFIPLAKTPHALIALLNAFTLLTLFALLASPHLTPYPLDLWPQFGFGVLLFSVLKTRSSSRWIACLLILTTTAIFLSVCNIPIGSLSQPRLPFIVSAAFAISLFFLYPLDAAITRSALGRALIAVGRFSFSLYLIHLLVIILTLSLLGDLLTKAPLTAMLILSALPVALAYPFYLLFERRFLSRRRTTPRPDARTTAPSIPGPVGIFPAHL
jgi:exopolysaccharide production protein ExoZ